MNKEIILLKETEIFNQPFKIYGTVENPLVLRTKDCLGCENLLLNNLRGIYVQ